MAAVSVAVSPGLLADVLVAGAPKPKLNAVAFGAGVAALSAVAAAGLFAGLPNENVGAGADAGFDVAASAVSFFPAVRPEKKSGTADGFESPEGGALVTDGGFDSSAVGFVENGEEDGACGRLTKL